MGGIGECALWRNGVGGGICAYTIIWHVHEYLRCHYNLAHVRRDAFINQVHFAIEWFNY